MQQRLRVAVWEIEPRCMLAPSGEESREGACGECCEDKGDEDEEERRDDPRLAHDDPQT